MSDTETPKYLLNDLFTSVQGEGKQIGRPVIFVRVAKCNMKCHFCDTNFNPVIWEGDADELMAKINQEFIEQEALGNIKDRAVLLTGGEPTLYNLTPLLELLKGYGYWVGIETNGRIRISPEDEAKINHITVSPKAKKGLKQRRADEIRLVVQDFVDDEYIENLDIWARDQYLSPMEIDGKFNFDKVYSLLHNARLRRDTWKISIQTHKLAGIK